MAACISISGDSVTFSTTTPAECGAYVLLDGTDYQLMVQTYDVTAQDVAYVFSWGFGMVVFFWSLGYSIGIVKGLINKL